MPRLRTSLLASVSFCFLLAHCTTAQGQPARFRDLPCTDPAYRAYSRLMKSPLAPLIAPSSCVYWRRVGPPRLTRYEFAVVAQRSVGTIEANPRHHYSASVRRAANLLAREFAHELRELGGIHPARKGQKS